MTFGSECNPELGQRSCETNRNLEEGLQEEDTFDSEKHYQQGVSKKMHHWILQ